MEVVAKPIRIGTDILAQVLQMKGMLVAAIADLNIPAALRALAEAGHPPGAHRVAESAGAPAQPISDPKIAITRDAQRVCTSGTIDVKVDATGRPAVGAQIGLVAMKHGKPLFMMNVEADVTIDACLRLKADRLGVIYSPVAGDEPSAASKLINFVSSLGYPLIAAAKGKNNPLNVDAAPDDYLDKALKMGAEPLHAGGVSRWLQNCGRSVRDAKATGLAPDIAGMHGPAALLKNLHSFLCPVADGRLLTR